MRRSAPSWLTLLVSVLLLLAGPARAISAQTPAVPSDRLTWDQRADALEAAQLSYILLIDGARHALTTVTCAPLDAQNQTCRSLYPPMTPGKHELRLIAVRTIGTAVVESAPSAPLTIEFFIGPAAPTNLRNERGSGTLAHES